MSAYVNVYHVDQAKGGPEEGGWWYDTGVPHASIPVSDWAGPEGADAVAAKWQAWCDAENDSNPHYTNTNGVGEYRVSREDHPAECWPKERPYYE